MVLLSACNSKQGENGDTGFANARLGQILCKLSIYTLYSVCYII